MASAGKEGEVAMHILMNSLYNILKNFSQIGIYGTGNYAKVIYPILKKIGMKEKINSFILTKPGVDNSIDGIPIRIVNDISSVEKEKCLILIATSKLYENEIVQTLRNLNFSNVIKLTDYIMLDNEFNEMLRGQTDEQFAENVINEYVWNNINEAYKFNQQKKSIEDYIVQRNGRESDKRQIVFISGNLTPRSKKIIAALIKKKFNIVVLEYGEQYKLVVPEIMSHNVEAAYYKDCIEILCIAMKYKPLVYYFEPAWGDCSGAELMIRHRDLFGKIVFGSYDVLNDGYVRISEQQKQSERYCLENADGVVWRWCSKQFLEEKKGFVYKGKSIQFFDYCGEYIPEKYNGTDSKLRLCFVAGGIDGILDETVLKNEGKYIEPARIDVILEKIGNRDDCIFHVFVGECSDEDRKKLDALENVYFNFKVFYGTKHSDLIIKLSKYDYGCLLWTDGEDIPDLESIDNVHYGSNYNNSQANVCFDYLNAGIPVIATRGKKQCDYLEWFGVLVKMNVSNIDIGYLKEKRSIYKKNVEKAKGELSIDNQIQRLIVFFEELYH